MEIFGSWRLLDNNTNHLKLFSKEDSFFNFKNIKQNMHQLEVIKIWGENEKWAIIFAVEQKDAIKSVQTLARQFNLVKEKNAI